MRFQCIPPQTLLCGEGTLHLKGRVWLQLHHLLKTPHLRKKSKVTQRWQ